jgi:hypothetical protein
MFADNLGMMYYTTDSNYIVAQNTLVDIQDMMYYTIG